uniref:RING-type domain-containing protein n=1 Tax=Plectus sambesii TaxID=2011161 RepID=A0A914WMD2_9BILA
MQRPREGRRGTLPHATPGVGECSICFEGVPCVKVLDCQHTLCLPCADKVASANPNKLSVTCPECRQPTDCSHGFKFLKTRYFGKIRCDICHEKKQAEDMWWCRDCVMGLCSKCSILEHAQKRHIISEWNKMEQVQFSLNYIDQWNKMEQVQFSLNYIDQVRFRRQQSSSNKPNLLIVKSYLSEVETALQQSLSTHPDIEELRSNLLSRYGTRFSSDASSSSPTTPPAALSGAPALVAKVMQLAGAHVHDTTVPKFDDQRYQLYFTLTPEQLAEFIRSKIEFLPLEDDRSATSEVKEDVNVETEERVINRTGGVSQIIDMDLNSTGQLIALHTSAEVQIYNVISGEKQGLPHSAKQNVRCVVFGSGSELLVVLQSTEKSYDWSLEVYDTHKTPLMGLYSAQFDVDPDDRIESIKLTSNGDGSTIFELRQCAKNVSEIWKAVPAKKKSKTKLKESLVYQRGTARYTALSVLENTKEKQTFIFVWDELSSCIYRLLVHNNRCELTTKVLHAAEPIPFCLDAGLRLWCYDPHLQRVIISLGTVANRVNVTFQPYRDYNKHAVKRISVVGDTVYALATTASTLVLISFRTVNNKPALK